MIGRLRWLSPLGLAFLAAGCSGKPSKPRATPTGSPVTPEQRDAETLGREVFELVDRAMDYRGSHEGRPANSLPQMGVESLTPATVRRVVNLQREPVVTVAFRQTAGREVVSCRGDRQVLEDALLNSGRFTVMCTSSAGVQRPIEVGASREP